MTDSVSAPTKSSTIASLPTSLSPRPVEARKVSTATFGNGQRGSILIPSQDVVNINDPRPSSIAADESISPLQPGSSSQAEESTDEAASPTSFHTTAPACIPPPPVRADGHPETPAHPETPQTSTSLASYISETSTLGPLATQQDIKDDPARVIERRQAQRKKLEKMLGNGVNVEDDDSGREDVALRGAGEIDRQMSE